MIVVCFFFLFSLGGVVLQKMVDVVEFCLVF